MLKNSCFATNPTGEIMVPVLGLCGASNSGKTTLLTGMVAELSRRGLKVGVLKHHGHGGPIVPPSSDKPKDTDRFYEAGAVRAVLAHAGGVLLRAADGGQDTPQTLARRYLGDLDLVLVEGFKHADLPKIEVVAPGRAPILPAGGALLALARRGGGGQEAGLTVLDADQPVMVTDFALEAIGYGPPPPRPACQARLWVDGRALELNPFVERLLDQTLRGLVGRLKGGGEGRSQRIEVHLG